MTKAMRMMKEEMKLVDCVVYVLDSRAPLSSVNPAFDEIIGSRPRLYVLNKCDLVPTDELKYWQKYFENNGGKCITANSTVKGGAKNFIAALKELNQPIIERYRLKGVKKTVRAMVIGVPNCGKSTLINSIIGKSRTLTGNRPGVTRGKQWVAIDSYLELLDTPGTLYPDFSDQKKATNLAIVGSIKEDILDIAVLAGEILTFLGENYPEKIAERYGITELSAEYTDNLQAVAKKRGYLMRGGEADIERAAKSVISDFRKLGFGRIILEKCNDR